MSTLYSREDHYGRPEIMDYLNEAFYSEQVRALQGADIVIVRGVPGSGKSTLARKLSCVLYNSQHLEADNFFCGDVPTDLMGDSRYMWDPSYLDIAHKSCFLKAKLLMERGFVPIVANTFVKYRDLDAYLKLACRPFIIRMTGRYKNHHGVPSEKVDQMSDRMVDLGGDEILFPVKPVKPKENDVP